jgi:hypothetical protein
MMRRSTCVALALVVTLIGSSRPRTAGRAWLTVLSTTDLHGDLCL